MKRSAFIRITVAVFSTALLFIFFAGCSDEEKPRTSRTYSTARTVPTTATSTTVKPVQKGIQLDPALQSATGVPTADEMKPLIALQAKVPYPVIVPTVLPGGYQLDEELIGSSQATEKDPAGYYSFRYSDPANESRTFTFNQSRANSRSLPGYYLTEENINGTDYQIYWHKTREYLPGEEPVRTFAVGDAETFVIVWKGQFTDAAGQPQEIWYGLSTGSYTGHGWGDISAILESLKPLGSVGQ